MREISNNLPSSLSHPMSLKFANSPGLLPKFPMFFVVIAALVGVFAAVPPVAAQTPLRFAVVGDFGDAPQNTRDGGVAAVANLALGTTSLVPGWTAPDLILTVGDNNYAASGSGSGWNTNIGAFYGTYIEDPTPGSVDERTAGTNNNKFFPATGNHDWDIGIASYEDYFVLPTNPSGNEQYYDFVRGPVHFFVVDSDVRQADGNTSASLQAQRLQAGLADSTSTWNMVFLHHPPYSSGASHGNTPALQWNFGAWGADAVFAGHEHSYERSSVGGVPYIVTGNGGHDLDPFKSTPNQESRVRFNGDYGATLIEADSSVVSIKHYTRSGQLVDSFNLGAANPVTTTATFQEGAGYTGAVDTFLLQASPTANQGAATSLKVDLQDSGSNSAAQSLVRFNGIFGNGLGQVPLDATIVSATLELNSTNAMADATNDAIPDGATLHRLLIDWNTSNLNSTWADWGDGAGGANALGGIQLDGSEALAGIEARVHTPEVGRTIFDITASLLAWQNDPSMNFGWVLMPRSTDGWDFDSAEGTFHPLLTINYVAVPEPATGLLAVIAGALLVCCVRRHRHQAADGIGRRGTLIGPPKAVAHSPGR